MVKKMKMDSVHGAIAKAEKKTSAEIVVTVVKQSGNYDHLTPLIAALLTLAALILGMETWIYQQWLPFSWLPNVALIVVVMLAVIAAQVIVRFASPIRWFTTNAALDRWVMLRAEVEFFEQIFGHTKAGTGVLIFVSLAERRTMIMADKNIFEKVPKESFDQVMKELMISIKSDDLVGGLGVAVDAVGEMLKAEFPWQADDVNEVSDQVILKDQ